MFVESILSGPASLTGHRIAHASSSEGGGGFLEEASLMNRVLESWGN